MAAQATALVVYESFFGNTRMVAEAVGEGLGAGFDVRVVEVSSAPVDPADVDFVVVGGPIHAMAMTRDGTRQQARQQARDVGLEPVSAGIGLRDWLSKLPVRTGEPGAAAFDTAIRLGWFAFGSAARGEAAQLRKHGYDVIVKPEHFWVQGAHGPLREGELERAVAWGQLVAQRWEKWPHRPHLPEAGQMRLA